MAHAHVSIGTTNYATAVTLGRHSLTCDEPPALGGQDAGPGPSALLAASLAACTAITLRMYAERKQWPLEGVECDVHYTRSKEEPPVIVRTLTLKGALTEEQRSRLADVAERTPVTLTLKSGAAIRTTLT
jgi:putative redox protein